MVAATTKTEHKVVIARGDCEFITDVNKQSTVCCVRARTPSQHASFLLKLQTVDFSFIYDICDTQLAFDKFYSILHCLLNEKYPNRQVTITSRDPPFVTPHIKLMFRDKNKYLKRRFIPQAETLARR